MDLVQMQLVQSPAALSPRGNLLCEGPTGVALKLIKEATLIDCLGTLGKTVAL